MTLLGCHEDGGYRPESGTIVLRDQRPAEAQAPLEPPENELLEELETEALSGTIATAGYGWLHATAADSGQVLRLEAHDAMPPLESAEWDDIVELAFHSGTGTIAAESLTGATRGDAFSLGTRGMFRARVARRPVADGVRDRGGDVWLIQFWPTDEVRPPHWLERTRSPFGVRDPGWEKVLGHPVIEVLRAGTGPETERLADWLDQPVPTQLSTTESLETACAQLGVPLPVTRRDVIPLLFAAGLLVEQEDGGYRRAEDPPPATAMLRLPTELAARIDADAVRSRYIWAGSDLVCVAAWQNPASTDGLAELLRIPEDEMEPLLHYAVADGLIHRDGTGITALPRPEPQAGQPYSETATGSTADPLRNFAVRTMPWTPE